MIPRYCTEPMTHIWDDRHRFSLWLKIEYATCLELSKAGIIQASDWSELKARIETLQANQGVDPKRVLELEQTLRHDVLAFTTAIAESLGSDTSRYIHYGLTSSDVLDTGLALQIKESGELLLSEIDTLLKLLKNLALKYQGLCCMGRTHGITAEPTSFGLKFLGWYCEWVRNETRLKQALEGLRVGKASGAVGVSPHWTPEFEQNIMDHLGLKRELVSTQVIPRDRHAELLGVFALCGSSMERIAVELRHLQRSEVAEVMEGFAKGQKGSSAMPHKRNPIAAENLSGCARLLRSYGQASLENVALWHERDISHSSVERVIVPDSMQLMHYSLKRLITLLGGLVVCEDQVENNLKQGGELVFSGHYLLELVKAGATREQAYGWIQACALESLEHAKTQHKPPEQPTGDFIKRIGAHAEIKKRLSPTLIKTLGSLEYQLRHVADIYESVLGKNDSKKVGV